MRTKKTQHPLEREMPIVIVVCARLLYMHHNNPRSGFSHKHTLYICTTKEGAKQTAKLSNGKMDDNDDDDDNNNRPAVNGGVVVDDSRVMSSIKRINSFAIVEHTIIMRSRFLESSVQQMPFSRMVSKGFHVLYCEKGGPVIKSVRCTKKQQM
jgi:hypothetical protein